MKNIHLDETELESMSERNAAFCRESDRISKQIGICSKEFRGRYSNLLEEKLIEQKHYKGEICIL